jgi:protoheme IX farnesyltransferase
MGPRKNSILGWGSVLLELTKIRITVVVMISTATGYLWANPAATEQMLFAVLGTLLLACGSAAMNHVQDASIDSRMERTARRPIPSGRISPVSAFFIAGLLMLFGFYLLASLEDQTLVILGLGLAAVAWYNGVYYYLKRWTAFAVVPGSLIGALPPVIGWVGGGGHPLHPFCLLLASFFFVWQIPHFWLLQLNRAEEYKRAGLPGLGDHFSGAQLGRITTSWICAAAVGGTAFPALAGDQIPFGWRMVMLMVSLWLGFAALKMLRKKARVNRPFHRAFMEINGYALVMMLCLSLSAL